MILPTYRTGIPYTVYLVYTEYRTMHNHGRPASRSGSAEPGRGENRAAALTITRKLL